jgi:thioesterase domain-containing protein
MRLIARIREEVHFELPLREIFENPTVEALATKIENREIRKYKPLINFKKQCSRVPIFCIHGGGGSGVIYSHLSNAMNKEQPLVGIQARGLESNEEYHDSLDAMVEEYVNAIRKAQPSGPYYLAGYSFGGIVAHAMTRKLELLGEKVSLLIIFDTQTIFSKNLSRDQLEDELLTNIANELGVDPKEAVFTNIEFIQKVRNNLEMIGMIPENTPIEMVRRMLIQSINCNVLLKDHILEKCKAPILLFKCSELSDTTDAEAYAWLDHTYSEVQVVEVNANHLNLLWNPSSVKVLAMEIEKCLGY